MNGTLIWNVPSVLLFKLNGLHVSRSHQGVVHHKEETWTTKKPVCTAPCAASRSEPLSKWGGGICSCRSPLPSTPPMLGLGSIRGSPQVGDSEEKLRLMHFIVPGAIHLVVLLSAYIDSNLKNNFPAFVLPLKFQIMMWECVSLPC